jgi:hypothetical protein
MFARSVSMLLVGSRAAEFHFPESRHGDIFDIWSTMEEIERLQLTSDIEDISRIPLVENDRAVITVKKTKLAITLYGQDSPESHFIRANENENRIIIDCVGEIPVARPSTLYLIKKSHIYSAKEWHKHILDMHYLAEGISETDFSTDEINAFRMRVDEYLDSEEKFQSMMISDQEFFDRYANAYIRLYPHDKLHEATCYYGKPMYVDLKPDASMAYISKSKFDKLSHQDKVRLVREEVYVLALERVIIPYRCLGDDWSEGYAFQYALRELCTSAARGWFRDFSIENYPEISRYDRDFYGVFSQAEKSGELIKSERSLPDSQFIKKLKEYVGKLEKKNRYALLPT